VSVHSLHGVGIAGDPSSPVHRLDPRVKLLGLASVTLVAVSTPLRAWPAFLACLVVLAAVALVGRVRPGVLWSRARVVLPLVLFVAVFVPFVRGGAQVSLGPVSVSEAGLATLAAVTAKATIGTLSAVLLGATTSFPDVLHGLERMRAPRLLVLIAGFMYRYLFVIVDETRRMRTALAARAYRPRHVLEAAAIGRVVISMFLRTFDRGERVYVAMLARGYGGTMPRLDSLALRRMDVVFLGGLVALLGAVRVAAEVMA
jgi:cobalt/nickel transport system permease protein